MADTLYNGLIVPILQAEPAAPVVGFVIYAIDDKVYAKFQDGAVKELTDG